MIENTIQLQMGDYWVMRNTGGQTGLPLSRYTERRGRALAPPDWISW
ncbi:hypothetical protein [Paenibacillus sp. yr247]|nr:hypothetical protein [Paenibacillus sp. yr247]